jgi:hypothetical protein
MAERAASLVDEVLPQVPVRQPGPDPHARGASNPRAAGTGRGPGPP